VAGVGDRGFLAVSGLPSALFVLVVVATQDAIPRHKPRHRVNPALLHTGERSGFYSWNISVCNTVNDVTSEPYSGIEATI